MRGTFDTPEKIRGFLHLYHGKEAVAVGTIPALGVEDRLVATYREHAHALVRGVSMQSVMAEMYGHTEGCAGGRGGSMHLFSAEHTFYGGNAIVGGALPLAVGLALADSMRSKRRVTACFFGKGAVAEGEFHESLNLAALWQLPVFVHFVRIMAMPRAQHLIDLRLRQISQFGQLHTELPAKPSMGWMLSLLRLPCHATSY
jgi:TPP-dependent pyruvate/acetoin dehydrogenase alpha subunit